jgi:hypothetical protein
MPTVDREHLFAILNYPNPHLEIDAQNDDLLELDPSRVQKLKSKILIG